MTDDQSVWLVRDEPADDPAGSVASGAAQPADLAAPVERTGNEAVDRVLDSLDALADTPIAEHVAVFEAAHDQLRGALADAGNTEQSQG
ncbi:MAG TPA: hypothetical protein VFH10_16075 [Nocardioides sp.]|uniref:hypothetical protein n=1 Tax=Nocardioides sp. TaxID=35761 RepID=UPI002D7E3403|nr:hypothetical protein [Nocardioides sp.]HET6654155.1 hypothetical protein [Nocardioides sp.]